MSNTVTEKTLLPVTCPSCDYSWLTASQLYYISCPRCRHAFKIRNFVRYKDKILQSGIDSTQSQTAGVTTTPKGDNG